jgi:hypothetical protein
MIRKTKIAAKPDDDRLIRHEEARGEELMIFERAAARPGSLGARNGARRRAAQLNSRSKIVFGFFLTVTFLVGAD